MINQNLHSRRHRPSGKSVAHEQIQCYLKKEISNLELEKTVGNRRADGVWEEEKIIFEIQLSPLTLQSAIERSKDYKLLGYETVWILHEKEFNRSNASPAEIFLRKNYPTYFTNGITIYDQIEVLDGEVRKYRGPPLAIKIDSPYHLPLVNIPNRLWQIHFSGDLYSSCKANGVGSVKKILKSFPSRGLRFWFNFLGYRILELCSKETLM